MGFAGGHIGRDRQLFRHGDGAGVQALLHLHDHDAGFFVAGHDRALDRRGAAPARQQRGVQIEAAEFWRIEHVFRQDQAIGHDHRHIGVQGAEFRNRLRLTKIFGVSTFKP